jgi:ParB family chromosome partitioning protein
MSEITVKVYSPIEIAIAGGADALPVAERGPLDTPTDKASPLYDERLKSVKMSAEWVENIKTRGVREMPSVVLLEGVPFLVNGRQRVRAARLANKALASEGKPELKVSVKVVELDEAGMLADMISLNIHHDDSPTVKIAKLKRLMERGSTAEEAAVLFATRPATINAWLRYDASAIPEVKKAVAQNKIPQSTGADIARLPEEKQQKALDAVLKVAVPSNGQRTERKGQASKAKRAIATSVGKSGGISEKKTLRAFLAAVENVEHPKKTTDATMMWWCGVESALGFVLGNDGADPKLVKIMEGLDGAPEAEDAGTTTTKASSGA